MQISSSFWRSSLLACCLAVSSACGSDSVTAPTTPAVSFTGVYNGTYLIASCTDTAGLAGFCAAGGFAPGTRLSISLSLGQTATSVTGNIMLGGLNGNFQGTATGAGLAGTASMGNIVALGSTAFHNVTAWNTTLTGNSMNGAFTQTFQVVGVTGGATIVSNISTLSR